MHCQGYAVNKSLASGVLLLGTNDLEKICILCEELFRLNSARQSRHNPIPIAA